jgi:hypothetical protein
MRILVAEDDAILADAVLYTLRQWSCATAL